MRGGHSRQWNGWVSCITVTALVCTALLSEPTEAQQRRPAQTPPKSKLPTEVNSARRAPVAKVKTDALAEVRKSAARIDELVEANYTKYKVEPNPLTTDEQFLRRIYLDVTGTIPDLQRTRSFLRRTDKERRERVIDQLLDQEGYVAHQYNFWADLLRLRDRIGRLDMTPYQNWIKASIRTNKPYDVMVREILTAEGKVWDNPATGYYLNDPGMPLDNMNNTVRIFLGTQIGCAQCHDHPFDRWTQKEFYELAAFTGQTLTQATGNTMRSYGDLQRTIREQRDSAGQFVEIAGHKARFNTIQTVFQTNRSLVTDVPNRELRLPDTYQYDDAKPSSVVQPKSLFGKKVSAAKGQNRREIFADWLAAPENPRFSRAMANRIWKQYMGVGLIEPVDDIRDESQAENEPLLAFLEQELIRLKFDLKEFQRIILNSKTYQRQSSPIELSPGEPYHYPGPLLRRMSPEQVWDSFLTLAIPSPDAFAKTQDPKFRDVIDVDFEKAKPEDLVKKAAQLDDEFLSARVRNAKENPYKYKGVLLARAYELPSPLPPGHFLREFGQSDRELIGANSTDGSIPQILTMLNGPITHMLLEQGSVMYDSVMREKKPKDQLDVIFLSILNRMPTPQEFALAEKEIQTAGPRGFGNVIWALVNTREFLFVQ